MGLNLRNVAKLYSFGGKNIGGKLRLSKIGTETYFDLNMALPLGVLAEPLVEKQRIKRVWRWLTEGHFIRN